MTELDHLKKRYEKGEISRRELLGRAAALAGAAGLAGSAAFEAALAAEPKKGGFARFGFNDGSQTDLLDPATWPGSFTACALGGAMCSNLTEILPDSTGRGRPC